MKMIAMIGAACVLGLPALAEQPKVGETARDFELSTVAGEKVKLSEVQKKGPVVLVVLRGYPGYQCPLCTRQVGELIGKAEEFAKAKASVLLIYPGPAAELKERANEFLKNKKLPEGIKLLLDPDYKFTNSYEIRWEARNETAYPSSFVIDEKGKILWSKISKSHGGRSSAVDLLKALGR